MSEGIEDYRLVTASRPTALSRLSVPRRNAGSLHPLAKLAVHLDEPLARPASSDAGSALAILLWPLVGGSPDFRYMGTRRVRPTSLSRARPGRPPAIKNVTRNKLAPELAPDGKGEVVFRRDARLK